MRILSVYLECPWTSGELGQSFKLNEVTGLRMCPPEDADPELTGSQPRFCLSFASWSHICFSTSQWHSRESSIPLATCAPVTTAPPPLQVELELLAGRAELLMLPSYPGFCSAFRPSNLRGALQLLEELQKDPIDYRPQPRLPDARGYSE